MTNPVELFSLQGHVYSAVRNTGTGAPGALTWLGNCSEGKIELQPTISDKYESFSGNRLLYGRLAKEKKGTLTLTLDEWTHENLALSLYTGLTAIASAAVVGEIFPAGLVVGSEVATDFPFISAITVHDSAGTPATLVLGTDYAVTSTGRGIITILNLGTYVQPLKISYTYASYSDYAMLTSATPPERYIVFDGENTMNGDDITVDLFRVQFLPTKQFGLIDPDFGNLQLEGAILYDPINALNATFGGFGVLRTNSSV